MALRQTRTVALSDDSEEEEPKLKGDPTAPSSATKPASGPPSAAASPSKDAKARQAAKKRHTDTPRISRQRRLARKVVESNLFGGSILFVILLNTALIALQTEKALEQRLGWYLAAVDNIFLGIYVFELLIKLYVYRRSFFKSNWNNFDAIIVLLSFIDFIRFLIFSFSFLNPRIFRLLRVLRAVRVVRAFRVLRTISFLKSLQVIVNTILKSIPAMGSIIFVLFLVMYIFAIIGRTLYSEVYPERFGSLGTAVFSLFQLITLDNWFTFMDEVGSEEPGILVYLIIFIILETFVFINLFIAVIVNNLQLSKTHEKKRSRLDRLFAFRRNATEEEEEAREEAREEEEETLKQRAQRIVDNEIEAYYPGADVSFRQKQLMSYYFMCLASLENAMDMNSAQGKILDDLVDLIPQQTLG